MKRIYCLFLALVLSLGCVGCGWMDGQYVSVKPHQVGYAPDGQDLTVVSGDTALRKAIMALIDAGETEAVLTLAGYPEEEVREDLEWIVPYCTSTYPIGAYAVEKIRWDLGQGLLSVDIDYRRSRAQIDQIQTVRTVSAAKEAIDQALTTYADTLVLQITLYTELDAANYIADFAARNPNLVMELPQVTAQLYPQSGSTRILELEFDYQTSRESLRSMASQVRQVFSSAKLYVTTGADDGVKLNQLYGFLMERFDYVVETSITPAYSLLNYGVGDSRAFAQVYAAMCRQSGLEVEVVSGTCSGESRFWNIVRNGDRYYHVDLLECAMLGRYREKTDREMTGYVWDYQAYPACGEPQMPEQTEP